MNISSCQKHTMSEINITEDTAPSI